jgi:signal peptidase I
MILINLIFTVLSVKLLLDIGRYKTLINPSEGMSPTIQLKERFVVDTWYYKFNKVSTGDILFFRDKDIEEGRTLIKRCVAIGGDNIEIRNLHVSVNGKEKKEDYINNKLYLEGLDEKNKEIMLNLKSISIPYESFFCLGDNRTNSIDSRFFGPISYDDIMGKVIYIYFSDDIKRIGKNL